MATRSIVIDRLAASTRANPSTVARQNRALGDAGLVTKGQVGGAGKMAHYDDLSLARLILAQAAVQPSDTPDTVKLLEDLRNRQTGQRFIDRIVESVRSAATPEGRASLIAEIKVGNERGLTMRDFTVCTDPPMAWESIHTEKTHARVLHQYYPAERNLLDAPASTVRRTTTISLGLILVAGDLYADTLVRRPVPTLIPDPTPGSAGEGKATPETTKASGTGIHEGLLSDVPATRAYPALAPTVALQAQSATKEGSKQSASHPKVRESRVRQHRTSRTHDYDASWSSTSPG